MYPITAIQTAIKSLDYAIPSLRAGCDARDALHIARAQLTAALDLLLNNMVSFPRAFQGATVQS
jgi:hypothetical protein